MISPTTRLPGVTLTLPADFHLLPLEADLARRVSSQSALLDELPMAEGGRRELVALYLEAMSTQLRGADIAGAAFCAVRIGDHASTATVTVGFHDTATTDRTLSLLGTVATLRGSSSATGVETAAYAGQPAARWVVERSLAPDADEPVVMRELQVLVQAPDVPVAVLLSLATPMLEDWDLYVEVMHGICETLRFTPASDPEGGASAQVLL
ncbi:MAG: hypothetical protein GEU96_17050, partial [Propionibacteriales bacterium]|nr:hypothetical protein [Propionibacteriales bacterium]